MFRVVDDECAMIKFYINVHLDNCKDILHGLFRFFSLFPVNNHVTYVVKFLFQVRLGKSPELEAVLGWKDAPQHFFDFYGW